jgi:hypothetical protein
LEVPQVHTTDEKPGLAYVVRGVLLAIVLGPVMVVAGLVAAVALISMFVAGWIPSEWLSSNGADWVFGTGVEGSGAYFFRFMVGAMVAGGCWTAIRWGFTGETS